MRAFWDASAIVPLCVPQQAPGRVRQALRSHPPVVWWGTPLEVTGAIVRLRRGQHLNESQAEAARQRLARLRASWAEIQPTERVRDLAESLLERHSLRAADAFQLSAALVWCNERPRGRLFVCGDLRLREAAQREGFSLQNESPARVST
jgi:predicted nucleic acid-binding protein